MTAPDARVIRVPLVAEKNNGCTDCKERATSGSAGALRKGEVARAANEGEEMEERASRPDVCSLDNAQFVAKETGARASASENNTRDEGKKVKGPCYARGQEIGRCAVRNVGI